MDLYPQVGVSVLPKLGPGGAFMCPPAVMFVRLLRPNYDRLKSVAHLTLAWVKIMYPMSGAVRSE